MNVLARVRMALFAVMLAAVMVPASIRAESSDEGPCNQDSNCEICEQSTNEVCWLPASQTCEEYVNCWAWVVPTCTIGSTSYTQCLCGPCIDG
jgi:hypothetical protein